MKPPRPGDPATDFRLSTPWGVDVSLEDSLKEGPVLIEFIRGTWDPNSRRRLEELAARREEFQRRRTRIYVITCERSETARRYVEEHSSPLSILVDEDRRTTRAYGAFQRFSYGAFNVARPASFLIDRCGYVRYAHVGRSPIGAAGMDALLELLETVDAESARGAPSTGAGAAGGGSGKDTGAEREPRSRR